METLCSEAVKLFHTAVKAVQPHVLVEKAVSITSTSLLQIRELTFPIDHNVYVVGFGKAVLGMASVIEHILGDHLISGIISVPKGIQKQNTFFSNEKIKSVSKIRVQEGAFNNLPDDESILAASYITKLIAPLKQSDLLLVLISGGGSALLPSPVPPITLSEKLQVIQLLTARGATIQEVNTVRKRLSTLKGGGLALLAKPAQVVSLILSDIIKNPIDLIASGPTVENTDDPFMPLHILEKYHLKNEISSNVFQRLLDVSKINKIYSKESFDHVTNVLLGTNETAITAATALAERLGFITVTLTLELEGVAQAVGKSLANIACSLLKGSVPLLQRAVNDLSLPLSVLDTLQAAYSKSLSDKKGLCIFCAGETVVHVTGRGLGGRNQELALAAALELHNLQLSSNVMLLSAGTDGIDGPTDAAGAMATPSVFTAAINADLNALDFLNNNDSYRFYSSLENGRWHVITGHTGTNVMDFIVILIKENV